MPAGIDKGPSLNEVRLAVKALLPDGHPRLPVVAAELRISARTLQRRLSSAGTTHSEMVCKVQQERAYELLARPTLRLSEIASNTGFASPSGFSRAFHGWTGLSPSAYRRNRMSGMK